MGANKCFNCGESPRYEFETEEKEIVEDEDGKPCPHGIIHENLICPFKKTYWHHTKKLAEEAWNKSNNWKHHSGSGAI